MTPEEQKVKDWARRGFSEHRAPNNREPNDHPAGPYGVMSDERRALRKTLLSRPFPSGRARDMFERSAALSARSQTHGV